MRERIRQTSILDYAAYFVSKQTDFYSTFNSTKLQAFCYRLQGLHYAVYGEYAFPENFHGKTWSQQKTRSGFVSSPILNDALQYGKDENNHSRIVSVNGGNASSLTKEQKILADSIYNHLHGLTGLVLQEIITGYPSSAWHQIRASNQTVIPKELVVEPYINGRGFH